MKVLITGANRGLGLALTKLCLERGDTVYGACRVPKDAAELRELNKSYAAALGVVRLDISSQESIDELTVNLAENTSTLDLLINNAAILNETDRLENVSFEGMMRTFTTNAVGPLYLTKSLRPLLKAEGGGKVLNISSKAGSISKRGESRQNYGYTSSKAALNMFTRNLAADLRDSQISVLAVDPGWVKTEMGGGNAELEPAQSAADVLKLAEALSDEQSGEFLAHDGERYPW